MVPTARPAGYLFSVAACEAVDIAKLHPTIVMYFDSGALSLGQALLIHRYESSTNQWRPLPTYLPPGVFYAATPINFETASNLVGTIPPTDGRIEYYRLFSVPI
jgi:hypothetical protein